MSDSTPPEDSFADLYGRLPDARSRGERPLSRREAREAAERAAAERRHAEPTADRPTVGHDPVSAPTTSQPAAGRPAVSRPAAESPAPASPPAPAPGSPAAAPPASPQTSALHELFTSDGAVDSGARRRKERRGRRLGIAIVLALVLVLVGGVAGAGFWVWNTYEDKIRSIMGWEEPKDYDAGIAEGQATVTIVSGDTGATISQTLFDAGVTKTSGVFYDYLISSGQNPTFVPGTFQLQQKMTASAALAALLDPANKLDNTVQLREGLTVADSVAIIAESLDIPQADLQAAVADPATYGVPASSLEGWIFPATYTFDPGVSAAQVIKTMVDRAVQSLDAAGVPVDQRQRILTIASIIQREARATGDFAKVSRVIQNRLAAGMKLQMDSTAQYGYGEMHDGTVSSSAAALADQNAWNTYVIDGLPQGPIANPGDDAIAAAMQPADGSWLYFVTVNLNTGETVFSTTYEEHEAAVAQWRQWCTENPGSGC